MKNYFLIFFFSFSVNAELILEITKGSDNPYKIAIVNSSDSSIEKEVINIVENDLLRTGEFKIFRNTDLIQIPAYEDDINFKDFSILGIDYLFIPLFNLEANYGIQANYKIYDIQNEKLIRSSTVYGIPRQERQLSHYISDGIYEEITGIRGVSSTKLLYVSETESNNSKEYKLYVSDADGFNEQVLLKTNEPIISPTWSPDSKKVAYVSFESGMAQVFIQDIASGERELVLKNKSQISSPSFSPDGKYLSLTLYQDGNAEIYILELSSRNLTRLTNHFSIDTESSWSPNGRSIIFTSGRSGSPQLYEFDLFRLNAKPNRVTFEGNYNAKASYLPNGDGIIFVHRNKNEFKIALKYFDENFVRPLTESKLDESPSIAPNGNVIIYAITEENQGLIAGLTLSGAQFRLPASFGKVREPSWSGFLR